jgi:hypothetical protein
MAKRLNTYRSYTASELKAKADIPSASNITVGASFIDCINISLNAVKTLLGALTYSLYDLCRHDNINRWSQFSPIVRTYSNPYEWDSVLVNSVPSVCRLGDFEGYNHGAAAPGSFTADEIVMVDTGSKATIHGEVNIGEIDYPDAEGIAFIVMDNYTIKAFELVDIDLYEDVVSLFAETLENVTSNMLGLDCGFFITNASSVMDVGDLLSTILCIAPNTSLSSLDIYLRAQTKIYFNGVEYTGGTQTVGDFTAFSLTLNTGTGVVTIGDIFNGGAGLTNATVEISLLKQTGPSTWETVDSNVTVYSGAFPATTNLSDLISPIPGADYSECGSYGYALYISVGGL